MLVDPFIFCLSFLFVRSWFPPVQNNFSWSIFTLEGLSSLLAVHSCSMIASSRDESSAPEEEVALRFLRRSSSSVFSRETHRTFFHSSCLSVCLFLSVSVASPVFFRGSCLALHVAVPNCSLPSDFFAFFLLHVCFTPSAYFFVCLCLPFSADCAWLFDLQRTAAHVLGRVSSICLVVVGENQRWKESRRKDPEVCAEKGMSRIQQSRAFSFLLPVLGCFGCLNLFSFPFQKSKISQCWRRGH